MRSEARILSSYLAAYRPQVVAGFLLVLCSVVVGLAVPFIVRFAIDEFTAGTMTPTALYRYAALYVLASFLSGTLALAMRRALLYMSYRVETDLRDDLFAHLTRLDSAFYRRERTGDIMTRMTSDLASVREFVGQGLLQGSRTVVGFVFAFGIMFAINVPMSLVMLLLLPATSVIFFCLIRLIRRRYEASQEQFSALSNFAQETFSGIRTIKSFGLAERQNGFFGDLNREYLRRNLVLNRIERPIWPLMALLFSAGVALLLWVGGGQVVRGRLSLGQFVQFNQYLLYLQWPMLALGWTTNLLQRGLASWKRLRMILEAQPLITDGDCTNPALTTLGGDLGFRKVALRLDGRSVLEDIDLVIPEGATVGITGPTGSGKTQLVALLARLVEPSLGEIRIGGFDVREYPLEVLRRHLGMAPQEPFLFSDTLAANLAFGLSDADEEKVLWAAGVAQLRPDVALFPRGFETVLGERGVTLSGGQRQRTAIGRAIAKDPRILILDDVFSAIDTQTEARILEQLRSVIRGRTTILISHRVSTLREADRIVVLEGGRITQAGTHRELVNQPGYYRDLDETQRLEARLEADA